MSSEPQASFSIQTQLSTDIMHARQQAEFAAWLAVHAHSIVEHTKSLEGLELQCYWVQSKARLDRWQSALKLFENDLSFQPLRHNPWPALELVVEEILVSEVLTRVWSALLLVIDRRRQRDDYSGLVYSVFLRHLESKNRALRMILSAQESNRQVFERLNRIRRSVEKWVDLLISHLPNQDTAAKFACDKKRLADFARESRDYRDHDWTRRTSVLLSSFQSSLSNQARRWGANPQLNRQIVEGVLVVLEHRLADAVPIPAAYVQLWLEKSHNETASLVEALDRIERTASLKIGLTVGG